VAIQNRFKRNSAKRIALFRGLPSYAISGVLAIGVWPGFARPLSSELQAQAPIASQKVATLPPQSSNRGLSEAVKDILDSSRAASPELHALALLLLTESNQNLGRGLKLKLSREAFDAAATVSAPVRKVPDVSMLTTDSDAGKSMASYSLNLDRLSLQSRAIANIAALDPAAARTMLDGLSLPEMPPVGCTQALVYRTSSYYDVLKTLALDKKANLKDSKDTTEEILYPAVGNLQTHTQVGLAMELLAKSELSKDQLESLTGTLVGQLNHLRSDERGFAAEIASRKGIVSSVELYRALEKSDPGSGAPLLREFRQYLIDNYKVGGCGALWIQYQFDDTRTGLTVHSQELRTPDKTGNKTLPDAIQKFNDEFQDALGRTKLDPIAVQDIDADVPVVKADVHDYWSDPESKAFLTAAQQLRFNENDQVRTLSERESPEWRAQVVSYLGKIDDWVADPFQSTEVFNEKLELYTGIINLTTLDDLKWLAVERSLSMLQNSSIESENPAQWLWGVMSLQLRVSTLVGDREYKRLGRNADFTGQLVNSKNRSLHLIGMLESLHLDPFNSKETGIPLP